MSPLHDLIISLHVKHLPINLPQNVFSPMQSFFKKKVAPYFLGGAGRRGGGEDTLYFTSYLFSFLKVSSLVFVVETMTFQAELPSQCVFKLIPYGYEIFQTVLSLNCNHLAKNM